MVSFVELYISCRAWNYFESSSRFVNGARATQRADRVKVRAEDAYRPIELESRGCTTSDEVCQHGGYLSMRGIHLGHGYEV